MPYLTYAMDTCFYTPHGHYPLTTRCEMLAELGYDATYLTLWNEHAWADLNELPHVRRRHGLDVAAVYVTANPWADRDDPARQRIEQLIATLDGCTTLEIATTRHPQGLKPSDPAADDVVAAYLDSLLEIARPRGIHLYLYPHINAWLERTEDAVRLCKRVGHPNLGAMFCGFHWFAVDGTDAFGRLDDARPWLRQVNLCGSRRSPNGVAGKATIEPLDDGEMDNFALIGYLQRIGYSGYLGIQGYSVAGDVYAKLRRSLTALRDIESRLAAHPSWSTLNPA